MATIAEEFVSALRILPQVMQALENRMALTEYLEGEI